jgi:hypothetical protein
LLTGWTVQCDFCPKRLGITWQTNWSYCQPVFFTIKLVFIKPYTAFDRIDNNIYIAILLVIKTGNTSAIPGLRDICTSMCGMWGPPLRSATYLTVLFDLG